MGQITLRHGPQKDLEAAKGTLLVAEPVFLTDSGQLVLLGQDQLFYFHPVGADGKYPSDIVTVNAESIAPTYTVLSAPAELVSGEKLPTAFGKLAATVKSLIAHLANKSNPHGVTKADVGLGNVTNESKATMFASPALTGTPTAPTAAKGTNTTQVATTAFVQAQGYLSSVNANDLAPTYTAASMPAALSSGEKLSVAFGKIAAAISSLISHLSASNPHSISKTTVGLGNVTNESKATMFTSPALTGTPTAPTAAKGTNSTQIATTAYVQSQGYLSSVNANDLAPTYTAASAPAALLSGEKLSTAFGKIAVAVSSLISHLSASNPHSISKTTVGLGNVTNESKATMFTNAALTGKPTAPTAAKGTNTTQIATTAYVLAAGFLTENSRIDGGTL